MALRILFFMSLRRGFQVKLHKLHWFKDRYLKFQMELAQNIYRGESIPILSLTRGALTEPSTLLEIDSWMWKKSLWELVQCLQYQGERLAGGIN